MNRWLDAIIRIGLVVLTIGIVVYALIASKFWAFDQQLWFFRVGDYQTVIIISIGVIVFGLILKGFLHWEIHAALFPKRRGGR
ncbi:MAG: hypothetical protein J4224_02350 [Candidatus Diapherotrites archaeon]|uniref:Uncharacterized protein n=1 Tax=Candidatus Iainarchaeum sp. TaxID=3101447 RepID=A0A7J4IVK7_9ARCH|nr:MAG: hypothetical protein QT03_C0001G0078 [archaeon GW2011_AR10]MBS3059246.1 hypothetical protein [Candidatus Diapherotrites archaeon]HIH08285.1 hypothetical protein [Candidatus Diapherotrites archaeon]